MKSTKIVFAAIITVLPVLYIVATTTVFIHKSFNNQPSDWFYLQRAYPFETIPEGEYESALRQKEMLQEVQQDQSEFTNPWFPAGPTNIGGRVTALDVDPNDHNIIYIGAALGGVLKSTNGGETWRMKTDDFPSLSIGALKIDPNNPAVIYCGTGEANTSGDSYPGFGMIKSTDYGETWFQSGLENSRHIGQIDIHPLNSNIVYAAVAGGLYSKDDNRGVYKSTDAGATWNRVFFISDSTSCIDVAVDPQDTNRVYAAMWDRLRTRTYRLVAGDNSGVYMSTDAGATWNRIVNGLPPSNPKVGRICIEVAPSDPNYVYALYKGSLENYGSDNYFYGFYRSTDRGVSWTELDGGSLSWEFAGFGWYFGMIEVDPSNPQTVYVSDVDLHKSTNGGTNWANITDSYSGSWLQQHPDQHALWINPADGNNLIVGNDGGVFSTVNGGGNWQKKFNLPLSQFYASTIDAQNPARVFGGTQDNGTIGTLTGQKDDWGEFYGGDGFHCLVDYTNSNIMYAESQWGGIGRSTNGGSTFSSIRDGIDFGRTNWSTPYIMDEQNPQMLFIGTYKVHKTTNRGNSWTEISGDLTRGDNGRMGTITALSSAVAANGTDRIIYVGTDDAKVSVTTNTGGSWTDVTGSNIPNRYITDVVCDKRDPAIAYVTLSGYNMDLSNPHVFRTTDYGTSWTDISSNLPDVPVNSLIIDYNYDSVLYVGADVGVFYSTNLGAEWNVLGVNLPNCPVFDLNYHQQTQILVAATHGRSLFKIDISNIISGTEEDDFGTPEDFALEQNYPNPFNPATTIEYTVPKNGYIEIAVYNSSGEFIETLEAGEKSAGSHKVTFNAKDHASGVYFYRLITGTTAISKKMLLLK